MGCYERLPGESDEELIFRICQDKEKIGTWDDVADVINKITGKNYGQSKYRKEYTYFTKMFEANRSSLGSTDDQIAQIDKKIRQLEQEKIRFRDERNAWNKQNYISARLDQKLNYLADRILEQSRFQYPNVWE